MNIQVWDIISPMESKYTQDGHLSDAAGSHASALTTLKVLFGIYGVPESLIDVGGGIGTWSSAALKLGVQEVSVLDGNWVSEQDLLIPKKRFQIVNLEDSFPEIVHGRTKFHLAICMEVAEHLSESTAESFVRCLCEKADLILFSAGIPLQGGLNHINEQWQSYWVRIFEQNGFGCKDEIRPKIWGDTGVNVWYRQNTLVFQKGFQPNNLGTLDVVHPENWIHINQINSNYEKLLSSRRVRKFIKKVLPPSIISLLRAYQ